MAFVDYYLPGYKAGGPIRTMVNMVEHLGDEIEFFIFTRDRDFNSSGSYAGVQVDGWNHVGKAKVFYASPETFSFAGVARVLRNTPYDVLYLNSFLSPRATVIPLLIRKLGLYGNKPVILAPRGEFSVGALALKSMKKHCFIRFVKALGLYRNLVWQASSEYEANDIRRVLAGVVKNIYVAPNLIPRSIQNAVPPEKRQSTQCGRSPLRVIFLSRISPMKNLDYLFRVLGKVKILLQVTIYGPVEDAEYWRQCQNLIQFLPSHISMTYAGEVTPAEVSKVFANHDLFVFPTRGENFGHVIFESLAAGTSVIVSDQTPWRPDPAGAVEVLSLDQPEAWVDAIERRASFDDADRVNQRAEAVTFLRRYKESSQAVELNRRMFEAVIAND